jgi:hypothetical protein
MNAQTDEPIEGEQPQAPPDGDEQPAQGEPEHGEQPGEDGGDDELEQQLGRELDELHGGDGDRAGDDAQPPAAQQPSEKEVEETYKKLDREVERHVKRVAELVGEAFAFLVPCELCDPSMPGFRWPREPADEVKVAVRMAIGDRQPENWQADQYSARCEACDGLGEVLTGSKVAGKGTLPCMTCGGNGWVPIGNERRGGVVHALPTQPRPDVEQPVAAVAADDPPEVAALKAAGYVVIRPAGSE